MVENDELFVRLILVHSFILCYVDRMRFLEIQRRKNERERTIFDISVSIRVNGIFVNFGQNSPNEGRGEFSVTFVPAVRKAFIRFIRNLQHYCRL